MELPQKIVDSNKNIKGFIIVIDEFQLLQSINLYTKHNLYYLPTPKNSDKFFQYL